MNNYLVLMIFLATVAFLAGAAVTLIVSERSARARQRRQALRERELAEISAFISSQLASLTADRVPPSRGSP